MRTVGGWTARPTSTKSPRRCANGGGKDRSPAIASVNGGDPTSSCLAELEFRIHLPPAESPSLSGFRLRPRKDAGFPPLWRPCRAAVSADTHKVQQHRAE